MECMVGFGKVIMAFELQVRPIRLVHLAFKVPQLIGKLHFASMRTCLDGKVPNQQLEEPLKSNERLRL